jgi:type VI secretion system secreted protein Hcp
MALDIFLKLGDVKGESVDKTHRKGIDVVNWSWGMMNAGSAQVGDGAGSGKGEVRDLEITKYVDTSSPKLMLACCDGTHFRAHSSPCASPADKSRSSISSLNWKQSLSQALASGASQSESSLGNN